MSKFPMGYFFILSRRSKPQLRGTFGSSQDIDRDPPEPDEEDRNKEEQLAEEAGVSNPGLVLRETRYRRLTAKQTMRQARE
jgi:hypothetical protein